MASRFAMIPAAALWAAFWVVAAAQPSQESATFRTGTRLVEVEVLVRDQPIRPPGVGAWFTWVLDSGPPFGRPGIVHTGLTRGDFVLLDQGKPQEIAVFRSNSIASAKDSTLPIPPGAVSNRAESAGQPPQATVSILIDFLNTDFGCLGYERIGMNDLLRSMTGSDSGIALYTLGEKLHVLQDFTGDPRKLQDVAVALQQSHGKLPPAYTAAVKDFGDIMDLGRDEVHRQMTTRALKLIIQHMAGIPGRKSLIWMMHHVRNVPPAIIGMAQQANIVLYPVLVRATGGELCEGEPLAPAQQLASVTGARAFFDSLDLPFALHATEEDAGSAYVLGFYPSQETLDEKYHQISVKLRNSAVEKQNLDLYYRSGYFATKVTPPPPAPSLQDLFQSPVNASGIGLAAQASPDAEHPGLYRLTLTVDLHDIRMQPGDGHFTGSLELSLLNPSDPDTVKTGTIALDLTGSQFASALETGVIIKLTGLAAIAGEIRIAVRDASTGAAGSLRIPVAPPP